MGLISPLPRELTEIFGKHTHELMLQSKAKFRVPIRSTMTRTTYTRGDEQ